MPSFIFFISILNLNLKNIGLKLKQLEWCSVTDNGEALHMKTHQQLENYAILIKKARFVFDVHRDQEVIFIFFEYNLDLIAIVKKITGVKWSRSKRAWYVLDGPQLRELFRLPLKDVVADVSGELSVVNTQQYARYVEQLKLMGYSRNTLRTYTSEFRIFLRELKHRAVDALNYEQLRQYFIYLVDKKGLSENQIHSRINAIKFYYEQLLGWDRFSMEVPRPKKHLQLPKVLSFEEVQKILSSAGNVKHLLILSLCYGTGIRLSEIVNIQLADIDLERHKVMIRRAKGKKDRYVNLPTSLLLLLGQYLSIYKPQRFLFEGQYGGRYSVRSVQTVFKDARVKAGVIKKVGIHSLRHSFATHCHEQGTDLHMIQRLLGHNNIKTTLIYTHVSQRELDKVVSPLDRMLNGLRPELPIRNT